MSKRQFLALIGVWTMIFIFLGLPVLWRQILAVLTGLGIIIFSYTLPPSVESKEDIAEDITKDPV